ncbi:TonB-dependent receptor [Cytophagales bacterium WSM2-2]|nr:TonB-dependent receptor [Cytophagales bacterium WSM2-2]
MNFSKTLVVIAYLIVSAPIYCQTYSVKGKISETGTGKVLAGASIVLENSSFSASSNNGGEYELSNISAGTYIVRISYIGYADFRREIQVAGNLIIDATLKITSSNLKEIAVTSKRDSTFGLARLKDIEGTAIYAGKKNEVIVLSDIVANTATNNSRQIYSRIAGLNIWENDGAGIQLGIGGRGLNPNRVSNFNTRQNGYDMSADALGYPESYYSPPAEAIDRIEILRGAASLQYGTQFGGMINFRLKNGPENKKIEITSRQTGGSWKFLNTFNSVGGTMGKVNYYAYYQNKSGNGWRPNSDFNLNAAYASISFQASSKVSLTLQHTYMNYLAHQPGGLTDVMFTQNPRQSIRNRNWFKVNWNLSAALLDYKINSRLKLNTRFFKLDASRSALGILDYINRADPMTDRDLWTDNYNNWGNETRLIYYYKVGSKSGALLAGTRYYSGYTTRRQGLGNDGSGGANNDFTFNNPDSPEFSEYTFPNQNFSAFLESIFNVTPDFSIIPGIRFENIRTKADGFYNQVTQDLAGNIIFSQRTDEHRVSTRSFPIAGIGLSYNLKNGGQLYANVSQNYRAINFNNMRVVNPNMQVDPNLKDEKGYSADLGVRGSIENKFTYDLSLFIVSYDNRIGTILKTDSATFNLYRLTTNVSESRNFGAETFLEYNLWQLFNPHDEKMKLTLFSNFSVLNARYIHSKEPAFENKKVELVPSIIFKSGITLKRDKWSFNYQFSYTGEQFTDASNSTYASNAINGKIPSYHVMDVSAQYIFSKYLSLYGSVNNLMNRMYFTRRADSYPGPGIIPSDGRSLYITLQLKI